SHLWPRLSVIFNGHLFYTSTTTCLRARIMVHCSIHNVSYSPTLIWQHMIRRGRRNMATKPILETTMTQTSNASHICPKYEHAIHQWDEQWITPPVLSPIPSAE